MDEQQLKELLQKYEAGTCTEQERAILEDLYLQWNPENKEIPHQLIEHSVNKVWQRLANESLSRQGKRLWPHIAAASVLLFLSVGGYFLFHQQATPKQNIATLQHDIAPGGNKAVLTLADGSKISLDDARKGELVKQSDATITKTGNGQLIYSLVNSAAPSARGGKVADLQNTLSTPQGGQYQLILPDGSHVWLNAASSITYPVVFSGKERKVSITGEAYFQVTKNKTRPFIVRLPDQSEVRVLGTHFNINTYADEPVSVTTLLEGSVRVSNGSESKLLVPGQQAMLKSGKLIVSPADTEEAVAWKNGYFRFNDEKIESIMRKLSRWYSIKVSYEGTPPTGGLNGKVSRFKNISQVLKALEATKTVHFKIEGGGVTVMP
ncbi:FecR domain-containing protein [Pedobacter sp. ISL-68]|uniref:FecR family protein n=1 Tax=unclassified Pedobacter TaxID=2628915 RepID=UPI001BECAD50|nr:MULTISPECIES: FecR domain-containing protein [unclassified Pedobacter]MBT2561712.1 FecR domain-containing protein [Pedobacter sp. ISL-64]MBT2591100.1 FecR domain-containing protein [Pedobacter sp. ISL-68]